MFTLIAFAILAAPPAPIRPSKAALWVTGTSNLHDWRCDAAAAQLQTRFEASGDALAGLLPSAAEVTVQVKALGCGNDTMDQKLKDALKMRAHPEIRFRLASVREVNGGTRLLAQGLLSIAGVERRVSLLVTIDRDAQAQTVRGSFPVQMTEFGVKPPTALLGTLKTGNQVVVHFELSFPLPPGVERNAR